MRSSAYFSYSDHELLARLKLGDEAAFAEIYARYSESMMAKAVSMFRSSVQAADVVQEIFLSLWRRRASLDIMSLENYLLQSTRFMILHTLTEDKARQDLSNRLIQASSDVLMSDPLLLKELEYLVTEILEGLPEDQRTIFRMHRQGDMTYPQIAGELGISVKTVEKKISQTLRSLRQGIGDYTYLGICCFILMRSLP